MSARNASRINDLGLQRQNRATAQFASNSTTAVKNRPGVSVGQRKLQKAVDNSPRMTAQRQVAGSYAQLPRLNTVQRRVIQRYEDVKTTYANHKLKGKNYLPDDEKNTFLDDFQKIQIFLADKSRVLVHLRTLNTSASSFKEDKLSRALKQDEENTWSNELPTAIGPVPVDAFKALISRGEAFEDTVARPHGAHSHRIQWHLIQAEQKRQDEQGTRWLTTPIMGLYKEAIHDRWEIANSRMWDRVLDGQGDDPASESFDKSGFDFTKPNFIDKYLRNPSESGLETLSAEANRYERRVRDLKAEYKAFWYTHASATDKEQARSSQDSRIVIGSYTFTAFSEDPDDTSKIAPTLVYHEDVKTSMGAWRQLNAIPMRAPTTRASEEGCCTIL